MFGPRIWRFGSFSDWVPEVQRLQNEMNRIFSGLSSPTPGNDPLMNVWVNNEEVLLTAELPGIDTAKLEIAVLADHVTVSGSREPELLKEGETYHRRERNFGRFSRTLELPFRVNSDKVEARYEKGLLEVRLPRAEEDKPRKIEIRSA
jgi:HSP20 family protein